MEGTIGEYGSIVSAFHVVLTTARDFVNNRNYITQQFNQLNDKFLVSL